MDADFIKQALRQKHQPPWEWIFATEVRTTTGGADSRGWYGGNEGLRIIAVDEIALKKLMDSLCRFTRQMSDFEKETLVYPEKSATDPEVEMMRKMIQVTPLEPLERLIIEGKLEHGRQFVSMFQNTQRGINPVTRKPFTRAWLSQVYISACEKLKTAYNGEREAA